MVGQHHGGKWPWPDPGQFEYGQSFERAWHEYAFLFSRAV